MIKQIHIHGEEGRGQAEAGKWVNNNTQTFPSPHQSLLDFSVFFFIDSEQPYTQQSQ